MACMSAHYPNLLATSRHNNSGKVLMKGGSSTSLRGLSPAPSQLPSAGPRQDGQQEIFRKRTASSVTLHFTLGANFIFNEY